jgi:hypothetical protein
MPFLCLLRLLQFFTFNVVSHINTSYNSILKVWNKPYLVIVFFYSIAIFSFAIILFRVFAHSLKVRLALNFPYLYCRKCISVMELGE